MASQWTMSELIGELTSQPFVLPVMFDHIENEINKNFHAIQLLSVCGE